MTRRRRIIFHIGLAKTGTTALQRFCHQHRTFLRRHGVLYPRRLAGRHGNHSPLVASYIAHRPEGPTVALHWLPRREAAQTLLDEIDTSDAPNVLVSSEHFSMHFDRSEALELAADFGMQDCSVVIVLRDPHARFLSAYNTHVTAGGQLPIEAYARSVLIPGTRYMSARETVLIWQEAFGRDRIQVIDYDATADVIAEILRGCCIDDRLPPAAQQRRRVSLGPAKLEALRAANTVIAQRQPVPAGSSVAAWVQLSLFSILCRRKLLQAHSGGETDNRWTVSRETMDALDKIAAADRQFVSETYGIWLRGDATRDRIEIGEPTAATTEDLRRADALVDHVAPGLWMVSAALVSLWNRLAARGSKT